jgi:hypothetical protein
LFHIRQSSTVADYVEWLSALVDQLAAYETVDNPLYYTMQFVDGLRDDIKLMVMIQRLSTLDTACALTMVQEEAVDSSKKKEGWRFEPLFNWSAHKHAYPLPVLPVIDKQGGTRVSEDRHAAEPTRVNSTDDKICALKQYRRSRGLCDRCTEKWSYGHQCSSTVQLHAIQKL